MVHHVERVEGRESELHPISPAPVETPELTSTKLASNSQLDNLTGRSPTTVKPPPLVRSRSVSDISTMRSTDTPGSPASSPVTTTRLPVRRHTPPARKEESSSFDSESKEEKLDSTPAKLHESSRLDETPPTPMKVQSPVSPQASPSTEGPPPPKYPSAFAPDHSMQPGRPPAYSGLPPPYSPPIAPPQRSRFLDMVPTFVGWGEQVAGIGISMVTAWLNLMEKAADAVVQLSRGRG